MRFWKCALPFGPESALGLSFLAAACSRNLALDFSPWGIVLMSERGVLPGRQKHHPPVCPCSAANPVQLASSLLKSLTRSSGTLLHCQYLCEKKKKRHPAFWRWKSHPWVVVIEEEEEWNEKRESGLCEMELRWDWNLFKGKMNIFWVSHGIKRRWADHLVRSVRYCVLDVFFL